VEDPASYQTRVRRKVQAEVVEKLTVRRSAFGVRRSAFAVRRSAFEWRGCSTQTLKSSLDSFSSFVLDVGGVFCSEKSPIIPQLFCSVILIDGLEAK
jgi:hypothetical protein